MSRRTAAAAGFAVRSVSVLAPLFQDFGEAGQVPGLTRNSARAVAAGFIGADRAEAWLTSLRQVPFLATFLFFTVVADAVA